MTEERITVFEAVGGMPFFERLVGEFYVRVEADPILRPMYPTELSGSRHRLQLFLAQFWGGPGTYTEERGHPRLRMRHLPFTIDLAARDAWLHAMAAALDACEPPDVVRSAMLEYFARSADWMVNADDADTPGSTP